jgi:uroporphyrin-3 C-methyltransferase
MADNENKPKEDKQEDNRLADLEKQINDAVAKNEQKTDNKTESKAELKPAVAAKTAEPVSKSVTPRSSADIKEPAHYSKQAKPEKKVVRTGMLWFVTLINFLLILCLLGAGYWFWSQWQGRQTNQQDFFANQQLTLDNQQAALETQTLANDRLQQELRQENQQLQSSLVQLNSKLELTEQQVIANSDSLSDVTGRRPSDWLVAEADYLVRMAGRKLWLENDVNTAILMLQSADSRLQDLADPSLLPIRQKIANDLQALQQVNTVSLTSVALALSGLTPQVKNLPLAIQELPELNDGTAQAEQSWLEELKIYITENMFDYQPRADGETIKPVLSMQQQWLVREQLKHTLLQAQTAILQEQSTLFQQSMQRALGTIIDNFDLKAPAVEQFIASLQNLAETNIIREYPAQLESALPLKDLLDRRVKGAFTSGMSEL